MKINTPVKINITELKPMVDCSIDKVIVPELIAADAVVTGKKDEHGDKIMIVNGNIEMEDIEDIFSNHGIDIDDYIVTDLDMIPDYDDVEVFDSLKKNVKGNKVNEKKTDCCPPKKKTSNGNIVNLYEALKGGTKVEDDKNVASLNTVIDSISGKQISESVRKIAMEKANAEYLKEKLGADKYNAVLESMSANAQSMHADTKINGKRIAEYSTDELRELLKKVNEQIDALNKKVADGVNESDGDKKITETLAVKNKVKTILDDEISFRDAMSIKEEDESAEAPSMEFKNLNPNVSDDEAKKKDELSAEPKNESDDDSEKHDDENADSSDEDNKDDEKNPDEDEVVELGSIVITLASEDAANDLKKDLVDAGVPEDAIEVEPVEDEKDEDEEKSEEDASTDETETSSDENTEETENAEGEHPEESLKTDSKNAVNEDDENAEDDNSSDENAESDTEATDDNSSEETSDDTESEDKSYKLILTDTDYVSDLATVLQDTWGMEKSEFEDLIGGEIVDKDEDSEDTEDSSDDNSDEHSDDTSSDESETDDDFADFDPDEIFKDL